MVASNNRIEKVEKLNKMIQTFRKNSHDLIILHLKMPNNDDSDFDGFYDDEEDDYEYDKEK